MTTTVRLWKEPAMTDPHEQQASHLSAYETHGYPVDGGYVVADLRAIAFRAGIAGYRSMTKGELIHALNTRLDENR
jgi:hypothetical protein